MKLRNLVLGLLCFSTLALAAEPEKCSELYKSQQSLAAFFNGYVKSGTDQDLVLYFGALQQYLVDVKESAIWSGPNRGNEASVDISESRWAALCTKQGGKHGAQIIEDKAVAGDEIAVKFYLFYSAVFETDGAASEALAGVQKLLKKHQPKLVAKVQKDNAAFFAKHPIKWISFD